MDISESPILVPGQRFGQYEIIAQIGSGGMGQVYKARHTTLEEDFAIKILHPEITKDPGSIFRLKVEARTAFHLKHDNVLNIEEFNEADGKFYMRMPLMRGTKVHDERAVSLRDVLAINGGRLTEGDAAIILHDVLNGLAYAHENGIIHRDIKPANILFNGNMALVSDFGLVRIVGEDFFRSRIDETVAVSKLGIPLVSASSGSSSLIGTYNYMSPEQKLGREADERSDVYAAGLIALDMLTGRTSFGMKAPSRSVKGLSKGWDTFLAKALEPEAADRYQSAREMLDNLPAIKTRPVIMTGRFLPVRQGEVERKRRKLAAICVMAVLIVLCGASAVLFLRRGESRPGGTTSGASSGEKPAEQVPTMTTSEVPLVVSEPDQANVADTEKEVEAGQSANIQPTVQTPPVDEMSPISSPVQIVGTPSQMPRSVEPPEPAAPTPLAEPSATSQIAATEPVKVPSADVVPAPAPAPALTKPDEKPAVPQKPEPSQWLEITLPNETPLRMRRIEPGTFRYGSPTNEEGRVPTRELTPREVTISKPFYIGVYEFTQGQYEAITGRNPSRFRSPDRPVEQISFAALTQENGFLDKLNRYLESRGMGNLRARLPTEEEWEYACRAGTTSPYGIQPEFFGKASAELSSFANYGKPYGTSSRVGKLSPNAWGLFDTHGNVDEITANGVMRGGSWASSARDCRSAARRNIGTSFRGDEKTGFRIVIDDKNDEPKTSSGSASGK